MLPTLLGTLLNPLLVIICVIAWSVANKYKLSVSKKLYLIGLLGGAFRAWEAERITPTSAFVYGYLASLVIVLLIEGIRRLRNK